MKLSGDYLLFSGGQLVRQQLDLKDWQVTVRADLVVPTVEVVAGKSIDVNRKELLLTILVDGPQSLRLSWVFCGDFTVRWVFITDTKDLLISCRDAITLLAGSHITVLHQQQARLNWQRDIHLAEQSQLTWYSWITNSSTSDQLTADLAASSSSFIAKIGQLMDGQAEQSKRSWRIIHQAANTQSQLSIRSVLSDEAQASEHCLVVVEPSGVAAQTQVYSYALLLDDTTKIQAAPELEVYCEEVNCRHGATSGHLDNDCLFYLASRGIDQLTATGLMIDGFLAEVAAPWRARQLLLPGVSLSDLDLK